MFKLVEVTIIFRLRLCLVSGFALGDINDFRHRILPSLVEFRTCNSLAPNYMPLLVPTDREREGTVLVSAIRVAFGRSMGHK